LFTHTIHCHQTVQFDTSLTGSKIAAVDVIGVAYHRHKWAVAQSRIEEVSTDDLKIAELSENTLTVGWVWKFT